MLLYIVIGRFETNDDRDILYRVFDTYDKAEKCFRELVESERESEWFNNLQDPEIETYNDYWICCESGLRSHNYSEYFIDRIKVE